MQRKIRVILRLCNINVGPPKDLFLNFTILTEPYSLFSILTVLYEPEVRY